MTTTVTALSPDQVTQLLPKKLCWRAGVFRDRFTRCLLRLEWRREDHLTGGVNFECIVAHVGFFVTLWREAK